MLIKMLVPIDPSQPEIVKEVELPRGPISFRKWSKLQSLAVMPLYPQVVAEEPDIVCGHISPSILPNGTWTVELALTYGPTTAPPENRFHYVYVQMGNLPQPKTLPNFYTVNSLAQFNMLWNAHRHPMTTKMRTLVMAFSHMFKLSSPWTIN